MNVALAQLMNAINLTRVNHMTPAPLKRMQRLCLKCAHNFTAHGRYNRICNRCKYHQVRGIEMHRVILPWD